MTPPPLPARPGNAHLLDALILYDKLVARYPHWVNAHSLDALQGPPDAAVAWLVDCGLATRVDGSEHVARGTPAALAVAGLEHARRCRDEATSEACGRGICAKHDGHEGPCDY